MNSHTPKHSPTIHTTQKSIYFFLTHQDLAAINSIFKGTRNEEASLALSIEIDFKEKKKKRKEKKKKETRQFSLDNWQDYISVWEQLGC